MIEYGDSLHLLIGGGAIGAVANMAMACSNSVAQRRIVRQQKLMSAHQQEIDSERLALDERAQIWAEMRDLISAQTRQLQVGRYEMNQLTGKYEELLRRHEALESECRRRHSESLERIQALEGERERLRAELTRSA